MSTNGFCPPWNPERFQMLDLCLICQRWKHCIRDIQAHPLISLNSDHALVIAKYGARLSKPSPKEYDKVKRYRNPKEEQRVGYNEHIRKNITPLCDWFIHEEYTIEHYVENFVETLKNAAQEELEEISPEQRKSYKIDRTLTSPH